VVKLRSLYMLLLPALILMLSVGLISGATASSGVSMSGMTVTQQLDGSWLSVPSGPGPFPGVLYNHGGMGITIGSDLEATSKHWPNRVTLDMLKPVRPHPNLSWIVLSMLRPV
jgi:hypothetical protein